MWTDNEHVYAGHENRDRATRPDTGTGDDVRARPAELGRGDKHYGSGHGCLPGRVGADGRGGPGRSATTGNGAESRRRPATGEVVAGRLCGQRSAAGSGDERVFEASEHIPVVEDQVDARARAELVGQDMLRGADDQFRVVVVGVDTHPTHRGRRPKPATVGPQPQSLRRDRGR
jgi:hypothetical protein